LAVASDAVHGKEAVRHSKLPPTNAATNRRRLPKDPSKLVSLVDVFVALIAIVCGRIHEGNKGGLQDSVDRTITLIDARPNASEARLRLERRTPSDFITLVQYGRFTQPKQALYETIGFQKYLVL
jgi:hypothetical protein